ncbi:increased loss of mitochondrial DNA protein 1 [Lipomyces japonicus]|uniref:increased loss of mitochondrial DNA protein 1 n=1 Tax=Lipomyces japonicus TaxID=56871 RepID=UPI0034CE9CB3
MLLSSKNICVVHFSILNAIIWKLLVDPAAVSGHGLVFIIGRAMQLPDAEFKKDDPAIGLIIVLLIYAAISDISVIISPNTSFLEVTVPFRLMFSFIVTAFSYLGSDSNISLSNSIVFTISFVEIIIQFWLYTTLREERSVKIRQQVPIDE